MANNEKQTENKVESTTPVRGVKQAKQPQTKTKSTKTKAGKKPKRKFFKEIMSELKKVSWPTFPKVVKQTGVVITVVVVFTLVLLGFDTLFSFLYKLLVGVIS